MPLTEATALIRKSRTSLPGNRPCGAPIFHTEPYHPAADRQELERLAEWCERFSPLVGVEQTGEPARGDAEEPESLLLDITGLGPLFGGEESLLRRMASELAARGYKTRIAAADAIGTAWGVARFASHEWRNEGAKDGLEIRPTGGLAQLADIWVIPPGHSAAAMAPLPLAALRLPLATIDLLQQLGIQQVGQLVSLPRASLASRFGEVVLLRIDQAWGRVREVLVAQRALPPFQATWLFECPTERREAVEFVMQQLIARIAHWLAEQCRGAVQLEVRLRGEADERDEGAREVIFRLGLFRPTAAARYLWELLRLQIEQTTWPGAVQEIMVEVPLIAPLEIRQGELFEDTVRDGQRQLARLIDRLSSRLGRESVLQPRVTADAQPEQACRYVPVAGQRPVQQEKESAVEANLRDRFHPVDRPLYLHHPPLPLQVLAAVPDGPPARFHVERDWHAVARYWGPERIETGWWRGDSIRRDYYRVETDGGLRFWLFRRLDDGRWFLQGRFE